MTSAPVARLRTASLDDVCADLREHTATDKLQFEFLHRGVEDVLERIEDLKEQMAALKRSFDRVGWSGWAIAGALAMLFAKSFLPVLTH